MEAAADRPGRVRQGWARAGLWGTCVKRLLALQAQGEKSGGRSASRAGSAAREPGAEGTGPRRGCRGVRDGVGVTAVAPGFSRDVGCTLGGDIPAIGSLGGWARWGEA